MMPDVPVVLMDLPERVHGFVVLGSDYNPCIVINSRMSREQQIKTYLHEVEHIVNGDMDDETYDEYGVFI